jgi:hypothetical protein
MADHIGDPEVFDDFVEDVAVHAEVSWLAYQGRKLTIAETDYLRGLIRNYFYERRFEEEEE